jgi:hypothetical protein
VSEINETTINRKEQNSMKRLKRKIFNETEGASSAGDVSAVDSKVGGKPLRRKMQKKDGSGQGRGQQGGRRRNQRDPENCRRIIKESDGFSFYQDNDLNVFEISDTPAKEAYWAGYKTNKPQHWQQNDITVEMMRHMNQEPGRNFAVKINGDISFPMKGNRIR